MRLWLAQILSMTAQNMIQFALLTTVYRLSNKSSFATSLLLVFLTIPPLLLATYAGVIADKKSRKTILVMTNLSRSVVVLLFVLIGHTGSIGALVFVYINAFALSAVNQFFIPAETATLPDLVKEKEILKANSLFAQTLFATFVFGFSIAGPVQGISDQAPYILGAVMFIVSMFLVLGLPKLVKKAPIETHRTHLLKELFYDTIESFALIKKRINLFLPILQLTFSQVIIGAMVILAPAFVDGVLHLDVRQAGLFLITPAGTGMMLTAVVLGLINPRARDRISRMGFLLLGATLMMLAKIRELATSLHFEAAHDAMVVSGGTKLLLISITALVGVALALIFVPAQTALSENAEPEIRGRVFGFLNLSINLSATLPLLITGILSDTFKPVTILFSFGILLLLYLLWETVTFPKRTGYA